MSDGTSVQRLTAALREMAAALPPGARLPSSRTLMTQHGAGPGTVSRAIARLAAEGVLVPEPGRGTFVAPRDRPIDVDTSWQTIALGEAAADSRAVAALLEAPGPGVIALTAGYPSQDLQPLAALAAASSRAARRPGGWSLPPAAGLPELRQLLAAPVAAQAADVVVVPGGQAGLSTAFRALGSPGAPVLVESPTYLGALAAARAAGLRPLPIPTDENGVRADLLGQAFARSGARLLYLQPTYANPTGAVLAEGRRTVVLDAAKAASAFIVEDDWARHLSLEGPCPAPLLHDDVDGHVVHVSSLSKASAPSLRIGALIARGPAAARLTSSRLVEDFGVARPLQETAVELLGNHAWSRHLRQLASQLRHRRDHLLQELRDHVPDLVPGPRPRGGLHLWLTLPEGQDDLELAERARARGLMVGAGAPYYVAEAPGPRLRLSFASADSAQIDAGVRILRRLLPGTIRARGESSGGSDRR